VAAADLVMLDVAMELYDGADAQRGFANTADAFNKSRVDRMQRLSSTTRCLADRRVHRRLAMLRVEIEPFRADDLHIGKCQESQKRRASSFPENPTTCTASPGCKRRPGRMRSPPCCRPPDLHTRAVTNS
jgi:hypothetical protein